MNKINDNLYTFEGQQDIVSPQLVYYPAIIRENIRKMIDIAGGAARLWPHIKTHKMAEVVQMQIEAGIDRFKCATIAEAEMAAKAGAKHLTLAYPLVGPNIKRFAALQAAFPEVEFFAIGDDTEHKSSARSQNCPMCSRRYHSQAACTASATGRLMVSVMVSISVGASFFFTIVRILCPRPVTALAALKLPGHRCCLNSFHGQSNRPVIYTLRGNLRIVGVNIHPHCIEFLTQTVHLLRSFHDFFLDDSRALMRPCKHPKLLVCSGQLNFDQPLHVIFYRIHD